MDSVQPSEAVDFLHDMVAIRSCSRHERRLAEFLMDRMNGMGYRTEIDSVGNVIGEIGHGDREIVLLGHMDTVPGGPEVRIEDGCLYGRGAVDAKGPLAAFVLGATAANVRNYRCVVIGAVEEEIFTSKGARAVIDRYSPDYCIIGEPSGWDKITLGYKGRLILDYRLEQPTTHPAGKSPSASELGIDLWNRIDESIRQLNRDREKMFHQIHRTLLSISSEDGNNRDTVHLSIGFRLPPDFPPEKMKLRLTDWDSGEGEMTFRGGEPAYLTTRRDPLIPHFISAIRYAGGNPHFTRKSGTSDMNVVAPVWSCPVLAYGPGDSELDHTPDEHIRTEEFLNGIEVIQRTLNSIDGGN